MHCYILLLYGTLLLLTYVHNFNTPRWYTTVIHNKDILVHLLYNTVKRFYEKTLLYILLGMYVCVAHFCYALHLETTITH